MPEKYENGVNRRLGCNEWEEMEKEVKPCLE